MIETSIPSAEQLGAVYNGLDFESFKQLNDEEVENLNEEIRTEFASTKSQIVHPNGDLEYTDEYRELAGRSKILYNFRTWRQFGIPDRELTYEDVADYALDLLEARKAADPNYGNIPSSHYKNWTEEEFNASDAVMKYCYRMRDLTEQPYISTYSLHNTIGLGRTIISRMVELGVLDSIGSAQSNAGPGKQIYYYYYLNKPYFDKYFAVATNLAKEARQ